MMSYITILDSYKRMITAKYSYECFDETYPVSSSSESSRSDDSGGDIILTPNPAYVLISSWAGRMESIKNEIFNSLDVLFNDPDDDSDVPDTNFSIINGYADGSQTLELYDKQTQEYSEDATFFYVRGNFYDMLPKANEGEYVNWHYQELKIMLDICDEYNEKYENFHYIQTGGGEDEETISKLEAFWMENYKTFASAINSAMRKMPEISIKFIELPSLVREYKQLFYDISIALGKIDTFIGALNKTVNAPKTRLSDSFSNTKSDGFSIYSKSIGDLYTMFLRSVDIRDNSKYASDDEFNMHLRKIFVSEVLLYYDYFNKSKNFLMRIENIRAFYQI